jgi:CMP/dCMP kinase
VKRPEETGISSPPAFPLSTYRFLPYNSGGMENRPRLIIAIDGPAGAGKSTVTRAVAARLGYLYIDTGAMYRSVALKAIHENLDLDDPHALADAAARARIRLETPDGITRVWLDDREVTREIRTPAVTEAASRVSTVAAVREVMVARQREWGQSGGVVMEGRDIGSVVFPNAHVKVYLDASPEERARRRVAELASQGVAASLEEVAAQMRERDARDIQRSESPLTRAPDAVLINTDGLRPEVVVEQVLALCRAAEAAA